MKKRIIALVTAAILAVAVIAFAGCDADNTPTREAGQSGGTAGAPNNGQTNGAPQDERFVLGDTAVFNDLRITADQIIVNDTWRDNMFAVFQPNEGNKFVAVRFDIENTSDTHQSISSVLMFDAYADGVLLDFSFGADFGLDGTLDGDIAPGRRMVGFFGVEVSENASELELEVRPTWLAGSASRAMFVFELDDLEGIS